VTVGILGLSPTLRRLKCGFGRKVDRHSVTENGLVHVPFGCPMKNEVQSCRHGYFIYPARDMFIGRSLSLYGEWSEAEVVLLSGLLSKGDVVVDVGANVGTHSVAFARAVGAQGRVIAYEPQRLMFQALCGTIALNSISNVECLQVGAGARAEKRPMPIIDCDDPFNFGGVSFCANGNESGEEMVSMATLDERVLGKCRLIKIDAEGMEGDVLLGAQGTVERCRPVLYVENDRLEKSSGVIELIEGLGYRAYWHIVECFNPDNYFGVEKNIFPGATALNMLCVYGDDHELAAGLDPVRGPGDNWESAVKRRDGGSEERIDRF
jgi:FkbM family methyltransferase